jgi:hypothetical protein
VCSQYVLVPRIQERAHGRAHPELGRWGIKERLDDAEIDAAIAQHKGDVRRTIRSLLIVNQYLVGENSRLIAAVSPGFMRGSGGHRS